MKEKRQGRSKQPWCEQSPWPGLWAMLGRYFESYAIVCYLSFSSWNSEWRVLRHRCYPQLLPSAHLGFPCLPPLRCLPPFQLPSLLPRFDEVYARSYCFSAHYIYHLLVNGYKFTEETWPQIRFEKEVSQSTYRFLVFLAIERFICVDVEERGQRLKDDLILLIACEHPRKRGDRI